MKGDHHIKLGHIQFAVAAFALAGTFHHCLKTADTSPLEPGALDHKFYAAGVGNVLTVDLTNGGRREPIKVTRKPRTP